MAFLAFVWNDFFDDIRISEVTIASELEVLYISPLLVASIHTPHTLYVSFSMKVPINIDAVLNQNTIIGRQAVDETKQFFRASCVGLVTFLKIFSPGYFCSNMLDKQRLQEK